MDRLHNKIVFALNTGDWADELYGLRRAARYWNLDGEIQTCEGVYQGKVEDSYIMDFTVRNLEFITRIARVHHQECVMIVTKKGRVFFKYMYDGRLDYQGTIMHVTHGEAQESTGYTEVDNRCYIIQEA